MERTEQRLRQFEVRGKGILVGVSEQTQKADRLLEEMIAEANQLGCFPREQFVSPGQLGSRKADVTLVNALDLGTLPGAGHALLIPAEDGTFAIVTAERRGIYKTRRTRSGDIKTKLEYNQFSTRFTPIKSPLIALKLRLEAARQLGEIMQTALELKRRREEERQGDREQ